MTTDICTADITGSVNPEHAESIRLWQSYGGMGELSKYRGFRHVLDNFPLYSDLKREATSRRLGALPAEYSLPTVIPACFPDSGKEVVLDQGLCGSCWAFAASSSLMANICMAGADA
eukprot:CAMPEP_0183596334 /NCGR_PEP_ID=MMETSP0371-20130417/174942_1 /TAXON_ID=268820 /ORGANISM="Peridinium aciculiferum, Strain PAER-2" /LENGTH=116 /DNA_ID=CAMNT_0025808203 /DNA_START=33 /DNA_END=380 /DNA_ORIENTATION=-